MYIYIYIHMYIYIDIQCRQRVAVTLFTHTRTLSLTHTLSHSLASQALIAEHVREFEVTLAGILDFEAQQAEDKRERQESLALRQGLSHGT